MPEISQPVRIKGLVRFFNYVQERLQNGLPPGELLRFREQVRDVVRQVEEICRQHRTTPATLPGPSRNAYAFLKNLDLDHLPSRQRPAPARPAGRREIRLSNVRKMTDYLADKMWQNAGELAMSSRARERQRQELEQEAEGIEAVCRRNHLPLEALSGTGRQLYCWVKFLCSPENLLQHVGTLQRVKDLLQRPDLAGVRVPVTLHLINLQSIYRSRMFHDRLILKCSEGFLAAGDAVWLALFGAIMGSRRRGGKALLSEFVNSEEFSGILFEMESVLDPPEGQTRGQAHDLEDSFQRVNRAYFQGRMPRPLLKWNQSPTVRKMGHYQPARDTVMISRTLDHARVPAFVIDYIMYHELLHKKHGHTMINGRRYVHTPAFRREEQLFQQYAEAEKFLHDWVRKLRK